MIVSKLPHQEVLSTTAELARNRRTADLRDALNGHAQRALANTVASVNMPVTMNTQERVTRKLRVAIECWVDVQIVVDPNQEEDIRIMTEDPDDWEPTPMSWEQIETKINAMVTGAGEG